MLYFLAQLSLAVPTDVALNAISKAVHSEISPKILDLNKAFEAGIASGKPANLASLSDTIKQVRVHIQKVLGDIKHEISLSTAILQIFGRKLTLTTLGDTLQTDDHFLSAMAQVIASGRFPAYKNSKVVQSITDGLSSKFSVILRHVFDADLFIQTDLSNPNHHGATSITEETKKKVQHDLDEIVKLATAAKDEAARGYAEEAKKMQAANKVINLWQKYQIENKLALFDMYIEFAKGVKL